MSCLYPELDLSGLCWAYDFTHKSGEEGELWFSEKHEFENFLGLFLEFKFISRIS